MAQRRTRGLLVLALAAIGLLVLLSGDVAMVEAEDIEPETEDGLLSQVVGEAGKVVRIWGQPHNVRLNHGGFTARSVSQGKDQWQLSVSESGDFSRPGAFVSQEGGDGGVAYGLEYDSTKSRYSVADAAGLKLKRVALSAASAPGNPADADWTLQVEGDKGRHFSATGNSRSVVYDGSFGMEVPVAEGLALRYAFDAKRRADSGVVPSWFRHSAGLRYASPAGDLSVHVHQPNPDRENATFEYEARLQGAITGTDIKGSPTYTLKAGREHNLKPGTDYGKDMHSFAAELKLKGPEGLTGGLTAAIRGGKPDVSAHGEYTAKKTVAKGIEVGTDAKLSLSPPGRGGIGHIMELHPVGLSATADLNRLAPAIADFGSQVDVRARYKLGHHTKPSLSASATLKSRKFFGLEVAAEAALDDHHHHYRSSGKLKLRGSSNGVSAQYEAVAAPGKTPRHAAQVLVPAELKGGSANLFGRVYQSDLDNESKPRLQLGVQYDFNTDVAGRTVRVDGESALFDTGSSLLDENGLPWRETRLRRARQTAAVLRSRIEGSGGEGNRWMHR